MQRRARRALARIGPPSSPAHFEKGSRRGFPITNRIWLLISLIVFVVLFTHLAFPTTTSTMDKIPFSSADLKPKIYLNGSSENPFKFCPVYGPGDEIAVKYGAETLSTSRLHLGSGNRVQRVLERAIAGQPVTISILGGSVSACHGVGNDPVSPRCYPSRFFQWWNTVFPHPATELTNGAMRRTSSAYFGFCSAHHLPDLTDLVIIELDGEDTPSKEMTEHFETLIRSILLRPDHPAIILLGHFSPQLYQAYGFAGPDHWHNMVAQFYDVPYISIKSALYPSYIQDEKSISKYYVDAVLSSPLGHELMTDILVAYMQSQICATWTSITGAPSNNLADHPEAPHGIFGGVGQRKGVPEENDDAKRSDVGDGDNDDKDDSPLKIRQHVPHARINTRTGGRFEEISPFCVSANDLINPLPPSLFYGSGWHAYHGDSPETAKTESHYWYATLPTSKIRIPLQVGAGDIGVYYMKEPISRVGEGSAVECWVDDNYGGARIIENAADVEEPTPSLEIIDHLVTRGSHFVECSLIGEEGQAVPRFRIIGIFST